MLTHSHTRKGGDCQTQIRRSEVRDTPVASFLWEVVVREGVTFDLGHEGWARSVHTGSGVSVGKAEQAECDLGRQVTGRRGKSFCCWGTERTKAKRRWGGKVG